MPQMLPAVAVAIKGAIGGALTFAGVGATTAYGLGSAVGTFVTSGTFLAGVGASILSAVLAPKVDIGGAPDQWQSDVDAPIPFIVGRVGTRGFKVHRDGWGDENRYRTIVTAYSGAGPIKGVEKWIANTQTLTIGANGAVTAPSAYAGKMWVISTPGNQPQASALMQTGLDAASPAMEGWNASSRISGKFHSLATFYRDSKFKSFPSGEPQLTTVAEGIYAYDPRLDSTYPGGSGSCRLNDASSWVYSVNPFIHALKWILGYFENGKLVGGIGADISEVDVAAFVAGANVADANGWEISARPTTKDDKHEVLSAMLQAGGGRYLDKGGRYSCMVKAPGLSVATVTADDTAGDFVLSTNAAFETMLNTLTPRVTMESFGWQPVDQSPVTNSTWVAADGGTETDARAQYAYVAVRADGSNKDQPAQLAAYDILDTRETLRGMVPLKPYMRRIRPGDVFIINDPRFMLENVKCRCLRTQFDVATNIVQVTFQSETDGKHDFALGRTQTPPIPPVLTAPDYYSVPAPATGAFTATAVSGNQPAISVSGSADKDNFLAFIVEYRTAADPSTGSAWADDDAGWRVFGQYDIATEGVVLTGLEPETAYHVAVKYVSQFGVIGERRVLGTITTGGLTATDATRIGDYNFERLAALLDELITASKASANAHIGAMIDEARARQGVDRKAVNLFTQERTERITATEAVQTSLETQISAVGDAVAGVQTSVTTVATDLSALTSSTNTQFSALGDALALVEDEVTTLATDLTAETNTRTTQISALNDSIAGVQSSVNTVATDLSALTSSTTTQFSAVGTSLASLSTQYDTLATAQSASASAITALSAQVFEEDGVTPRLATVTDVAAVSASVDELLATRLITAQAGAAFAGVQFSALTSGETAASEIRFAGQVLAYGATFDTPRRFFDAQNGVEYALDAGGTVRTFELNWSTGRGQFRDASGNLLFDTAAGGVQYAGLPAITGSVVFENAAEVALPSAATWTEVAALSLTTVASSRVFVQWTLRCLGGDGPINGRLKRGATVIWEGQLAELFGLRDYNVIESGVTNFDHIVQVPGVQNIAVTLFDVDEPGAGSQTYTLEAQGFDADNRIKDRKMIALDLRA